MSDKTKNTLISAITALATAAGVSVMTGPGALPTGTTWSAGEKRVAVHSATTTEKAPAFVVTAFDTILPKQGVCLKLKDADGEGYTYVAASNGELTSSQTPCD